MVRPRLVRHRLVRHVDVHIRRLRKALDGAADLIRTLRAAGYALDQPANALR